METFEKDQNLAQQIAEEYRDDIEKNYEEGDLYNYFFGEESDICDIMWMLDDDFEYFGVEVMFDIGGPNIWISTTENEVQCYWRFGKAAASLKRDTIEAIDEIFEEVYECRRYES